MVDASARPPRPTLQAWTEDTPEVLSAWLTKKRTGMGSMFGKDRLYFSLDFDACTLSWAKRPQEKVEMTLGFKDFQSVTSSAKNEVPGTPEAEDDSSTSTHRPSSRSSGKSSLGSISSLGARIRSMSPFRKPKTEHRIVVQTGERSLELTCESKEQSDQWLAALQLAMNKGGGRSSPKAVATYVDFQPPTRRIVVGSRSSGANDQEVGFQQSQEIDVSAKPLQGTPQGEITQPVRQTVAIVASGNAEDQEMSRDTGRHSQQDEDTPTPSSRCNDPTCPTPANPTQLLGYRQPQQLTPRRKTLQTCDISEAISSSPTPMNKDFLPADQKQETLRDALEKEISSARNSVVHGERDAKKPPLGKRRPKADEIESCWAGVSLDDALGPKPKPPRRTFASEDSEALNSFASVPRRRKSPTAPDCWAGVALGDAFVAKAGEEDQEGSEPNSTKASDRTGSAQVRASSMGDLADGALKQISSPERVTPSKMERSEEPRPRKSSQCDMAIDAPRRSPKSAEEVDEETAGTRKMFDKRELRRRHRAAFEKHVSDWRGKHTKPVKSAPSGLDSQRIRVCVRKRPMFSHEDNEFDVITARGSELVVHNCLTKADLKTLFVGHMGFHFARVFDEHVGDTDVYAQCGEPAVNHALQGGSATIFMFGQTGSGKTHTMQALLRQAADQLLCGLDEVFVGAFEIAGKNLRDLQDTANPKKELKVMVDKENDATSPGQLESGCVSNKIHGLRWCSAQSAEELLELCQRAQERRTTRATQANETSSRSHSVLRIGRSDDDICLTLVDCAGSERNEDSTHHSAQDRKDAADINSTIFALKECFRAMRSSGSQQPPFRNSLLTRVLADSLTNKKSKVIAIGTVSPAARDTEHSIETLKSLQMLQGTQMTFENREDIRAERVLLKHPRTWSEDEVRQWLARADGGRAERWSAGLSKGTEGKVFVRWPAARFAQLCDGDKELGEALFKELREEMKAADESRCRK